MKKFQLCVVAACLVAGLWGKGFGVVPWATTVVQYNYDGDANPANDDAMYSNPAAALGEPSRMAGVGTGWDQVVSMFNGPWTGGEVVSVASGGQLVVSFDQPIRNDASHLYGVDLLVFGNATFTDMDWPNGLINSPAMLWEEKGKIEVSADGLDWRTIPGVWADSLFPTQAYLDSGPADVSPGLVPADFTRPVNPALTLAAFDGLTFSQAMALYDGSAGGAPVDIGAVGLDMIQYVRVTVPVGAHYTVEVDGFAAVPEPASLLLLAVAGFGAFARRRVV